MRSNWGGLLTNASPYAIPPGAAVVQVNLNAASPGQLSSRSGMRHVSFAEHSYPDVPELRDLFPYVYGGGVRMLALAADGSVISLSSPTVGSASTLGSPSEPSLSPPAGGVDISYTGRIYDSEGEAPA